MPASIRDVMPAFELFQPASVADTLGLLERHGNDAWIMAGGLDTFDWLKDRIQKPKVVIDLSNVSELRGIKERDGGIEIGALTTLTTITRDPLVTGKYKMLAEAAGLVASPQIRNQGTLGGESGAGRALLVLPRGLAVLPRRRQHLLRRYADIPQSRACDLRGRPVRRSQSFRYGAYPHRARCAVCHHA